MKLFTIALSILLLQAQSPRSTIEGTVVRAGSGEPIVGANITLARSPGSYSGPPESGLSIFSSAITDSHGKYVVKDVVDGKYIVTVVANGYVKRDYGQRSLDGQGTPITLAAGQTARDINVALTSAGNLSGHIRDNAGMPAVGVTVQLLRVVYAEDGEKGLETVQSERTNDRGEYRLYWITPGRYYVDAGSVPGFGRGPSGSRPVSPNQIPDETFAYALYPGVTNVNQAVAIDVAAGSDIVGVDFPVARQQKLSVRGRVIDSRTGLVPAAVDLELGVQSFNDRGGYFGTGNYNPSTGTFEWTGLNPGSYMIQAATKETVLVNLTSPGSNKITRPINLVRMPIELTSSDVDGLVLTLVIGSTLQYHLKAVGESTPALAGMLIWLRPSMNGVIRASRSIATYLVPIGNPDGSYRIDNVPPGQYRIATTALPPEYYLKEARYNQIDVLNNPLEYSATESGSLEVTVAKGAVRITGTALDQQSRPVEGIPVVLVPDQHRDRSILFLNATTDANGRYILRQVPPGDYKLYGWDGLAEYSWFDPEVLAKYESQGKPVHVIESSNQTVDLKVIH